MGERIRSLILLILITIILSALVVWGLDIFGIIMLPEKYSIKTLIDGENKNETKLVVDNIVSYPKEYHHVDNTETPNVEENQSETANGDLEDLFGVAEEEKEKFNKPIISEGILYGANNTFYFNQLNPYGKTIYKKIYDNLDKVKTGTYTIDFDLVFNELLATPNGEKELTDAFQLGINAMLLDHPEIFYLDVTRMYMFTKINKTLVETKYYVSIGPEDGENYLLPEFPNKESVLEAEKFVNDKAFEIISKISGNEYIKSRKIHNWIIENIKYDENDSLDNSHNIYGLFKNNQAVCDGYAKAYKYLLDCAGIHCVQVCGKGQNSLGVIENHTWNYVYLNEKWYAVDVTWDDPIITGGGYLTDSLKYKNFMLGSIEFFENHQEDGFVIENGAFVYPTLSETNF